MQPHLDSILDLELKANDIRQDVIRMLIAAKAGHTAGPLGMADIFAALYFNVMKHDPANPHWAERDRLVLSNGHIAPVLYATLAQAGYFDRKLLDTLRKLGSPLQGHPHRGSLPGLETSSGPLGQGLAQACGMALATTRADKRKCVYWCLVSDGEQQEGSTWEAVMLAAKYSLGNVIGVMDRNDIQIDGKTEEIMPIEPLAHKYRAFGWDVVEIDGHDMGAIVETLGRLRAQAEAQPHRAPTMVIARTVPGKGVPFMENDYKWHGKPPSADEGVRALAALDESRKAVGRKRPAKPN